MSSLRKIDANRRNAKLGGPKTPEGKAKSALNSTKHGLTAKTLILDNESRPAFKELQAFHIDRFQPADAFELDLVNELVACRWRLRGVWHAETAMIDREMDKRDERMRSSDAKSTKKGCLPNP